MSKNPLILFEGIECSGKTTQIKKIKNYLKKKKKKFIHIREPGGSNNSEKIRTLLLNDKFNSSSMTDLFLYMASRNENFHKLIKKNYKKKIILIDRFIDSTIAYQHYGMNINKNLILTLNKHILGKINPDLTFLNIVNKKNLFQRLKKRNKKNRYDLFNYNFYRKVQNGFLKIAKNNKKYIIVDSNKSILDNKSKIIQNLNKLLQI